MPEQNDDSLKERRLKNMAKWKREDFDFYNSFVNRALNGRAPSKKESDEDWKKFQEKLKNPKK